MKEQPCKMCGDPIEPTWWDKSVEVKDLCLACIQEI